ncbi:DUF4783 domain-containing protein [Sphingobacterium corticis]|uniref:DUF4783 domain-containing protein n=1 Tax=Sphingobacterium corticis TaxID=1812823 RepID=A0ABW5NLV1_9SPHI
MALFLLKVEALFTYDMITAFIHSCFILPLLFFGQLEVSLDIQKDILQAIKDGQAKKIAAYFGENVSITLKDNVAYYSKFQAEMVLQDFFRTYKAVDVKQVQGVNKDGSQNYIIYEFNTNSRSFRVFVRFAEVNNSMVISELRIE